MRKRFHPSGFAENDPSLVTIDGQRQLIIGAGDGAIWGFQPRTGKPLWSYDFSLRGIYATPLVVGNRVFASHCEENVSPNANVMGAVAALEISGVGDDTTVEELWKQMEVVVGYSEPVLIDDRLYVVDDRCKMWVFDAKTGEPIVERKSFAGNRQRSALLHADGKIYVLTENGPWAILKPTEDGFEVIKKGRVRGAGFGGSPILADGRLYFPSTTTLYCVALDGSTQDPVSLDDSLGQETPVSENPEIAQVQIIPAESLVKPGEKLELRVRVFNALGQRLKNPSQVSYSVEGPGSIDGSTFIASADAAHTAAFITARVGDASGTARVRIVPELPWKFTFDE